MIALWRGVVSGLVLGAFASAQFSALPNTGCSGGPNYLVASGSARVGNTYPIATFCRTPSVTELPVLVLGFETLPAWLPLGLQCNSLLCLTAVQPVVAIVGPVGLSPFIVQISIPNNPALIGSCIAGQGVCAAVQAGCLTVTTGFRMCVQP